MAYLAYLYVFSLKQKICIKNIKIQGHQFSSDVPVGIDEARLPVRKAKWFKYNLHFCLSDSSELKKMVS